MHIYFRSFKDDSILEEFKHVISIVPDYESTNNCIIVNFVKEVNENGIIFDCRYLSLFSGYITMFAERCENL